MPGPAETILILGGTAEAAELARRLVADGRFRVVTSLAGRTKAPAPLPGETRIGGFGGPDGLTQHLIGEGISKLVDATHPFAARISKNAHIAAEAAQVPLLRLVRPPWLPELGDDWRMVASLEDAASVLPAGARVFLALGHQHLAGFTDRRGCAFVARMTDAPDKLPLPGIELVIGKPSRNPDEEAELLSAHAITHLVCRNSGGDGARAKLTAARRLDLPVIMIERPDEPAFHTYESVDELMSAISR